ncbi:MAG: hypothetical protein DRZ79_04490 [Candidatus Cloacimonadota bacterium]|nr:MAG: hypothetical protein DRZ79_04490 [Candidatus Cloacimonadota bacterium]
MKKFATISAFVFLLIAMLSAGNFDDELLQKARKIAETNQNLVPGLIRTIMYQTNKQGEKKGFTEIIIKTELDKDGKIKNKFVKGSIDGKEVDENNPAVKKSLETDYSPKKESLFFGEEAKNVQFSRTEREENINGIKCMAFEYSRKMETDGKKYSEKGVIWLDEKSGKPIRREFTLDPLPKTVKSMTTSILFDDENGNWVCKRIVSDISVQAMLLIKMNVHSEINFSDYWKYNENTR